MKKTLSILLAVLLIAALFAGCTGTEKPADKGAYVTVNGVNVTTGLPFADVKDGLGKEIKPAETIDSCDPNSDWKQTMHFYDGVTVTEDKDGNIDGVQVFEGDSALMGKLKIGATKEDVKALLGEPDTDESWGIYYESASPWVSIYLDEETGLVSGFALMLALDG